MEDSLTLLIRQRQAIEFLVREKAAKLFIEDVLGISTEDKSLSVCSLFLSAAFHL
jgi:hypothetical protein